MSFNNQNGNYGWRKQVSLQIYRWIYLLYVT